MMASNPQIMRALLAKDRRLFRLPMTGLLVASAGSYLVAFIVIPIVGRTEWSIEPVLLAAPILAIEMTALLASTFGGLAIAGERSDQTADFLGLLPVTRKQIVLSKWIVSIFTLGFCGLFHTAVALFLTGFIAPHNALHDLRHNPAGWASVAAFGVLWIGCTTSFFGVAWLLSTFTKSGPISACTSIAVTLGSAGLTGFCIERPDRIEEWKVLLTLGCFMLAIGLSSLIAGTVHYLRRIEP
jgi:ABC-type transport system involved in multi-copper enzyme maturation permease subunit